MKKPPKQLYVLGDETLLNKPNIAIVGSRNATQYGQIQAKRFAEELTQGGFNIVSGMAKGIDKISHEACIDANGKTIAVLGGGFNNIYPKENIPLFYKILETGGAIISEYAPNEEANNYNFPARNRIISGLSVGVLVIEAAYRSGTSITAKYAREQGKDVYCVPSNVDSSKMVGVVRLIEKGARVVLKPEDILRKYNLSKRMIKPKIVSIPIEYKKLYDCIHKGGTHINDIAKNIKKPIQEVSNELFMMELEGYIEKIAGGYYVPKT